MTHTNHLVEQHIKKHLSRLRHIDELMQEAKQSGDQKTQAELKSIKEEQQKIGTYMEQFRDKSAEQFLQTAGPMVMWEIIAQRLERLVERIHH